MASGDEIKLTLDTAEAIQQAKKFGPELNKALSINSAIPGVEKYQKALKKAADDAGIISEKTGKMTGAFNTVNLDKYDKRLEKAVEYATQLQTVYEKLAKLGISENGKGLKSLEGKLGAATRSKDADKIATAKANLNAAKDLIAEQAVLEDKLQKELSTVETIAGKVSTVTDFENEHGQAVSVINDRYAEIEQKIDSSKVSEEGVTESAKETSSAVEETSNALSGANEEAKSFSDTIKEVTSETKDVSLGEETSEVDETKTKLAELMTALSQSAAELERMRAAGQSAADVERKLADTTDAVKQKLTEMLSVSTDKMSTLGLTRYSEELKQARSLLEKTPNISGFDGYYDAILKREAEVQKAIKQRQAEMSGTQPSGLSGANLQITQAMASGFDSVGSAISNAGKYLINFSDILNIVRLAMGDVTAAVPLITSAFQKITNVVKSVIQAIKNLVSQMIKFATQVANKFFNVIKKGFAEISKSSSSSGSLFDPRTLKRAIQLIAKYVFGFRSFFFLYRKLRALVKEGLQNLVQFESETNQTNKAITELRTSLLYIKNAWAAAFAPIINVVQPLLTYLMDALAEVGNAIARFVGALTGQAVVLNAVKVDAGDYAKSLDNVGGSAGSAANKTKKLTDRLAAFDDLNVLGKDNDPTGSGSGGGGGAADSLEPKISDMFTYVKAVSSFADMLKEAWKTANFTEVGQLVHDKIMSPLKSISWDDIKDIAYKVGKAIITFFNGVLADPNLWKEIGMAIGEGLNTIGRFVAGLLENNKINFGFNLAELILNAFRSFNVNEFVKNLNSLSSLIADNINAFFRTIFNGDGGKPGKSIFGDISKMASGVTNAIINLIRNLDWATIIETALMIGDAILTGIIKALNESDNPVLQAIGNLLQGLEKAAKDLLPLLGPLAEQLGEIGADTLNDIADLLPLIIQAVKLFVTKWLPDMIDTLDELRPTLKWLASGGLKKIITLLNEFDFNDLVEQIKAIGGAVLFAATIFSMVAMPIVNVIIVFERFKDTIEAILDAFDDFDIEEWIEDIKEAGKDIVEGLKEGIQETDLYQIAQTIFQPLIDGFKELFGINSPSTVFEEFGTDIIQGLLNGIDTLKEDVKQKWEDIKQGGDEKFSSLKEKVVAHAQNIKDKVEAKWVLLKQSTTEKFTDIKEKILEIWNKIKEGIKAPINAALGFIESFVNKVIRGINSLIDKINSIADVQFTNPFTNETYTLGFNIPRLSTVTIPRLAQGAVIPPNKEFMAVLGDQTSGTNIEAPLDTIKQAVAEELSAQLDVLQNGFASVVQAINNKDLNIGDKQIGMANARYNARQNLIRGTSF